MKVYVTLLAAIFYTVVLYVHHGDVVDLCNKHPDLWFYVAIAALLVPLLVDMYINIVVGIIAEKIQERKRIKELEQEVLKYRELKDVPDLKK